MSAVLKSDLVISVEDYHAGEVISEVRHEYAGGEVYAMAGASNVHNIPALNLAAAQTACAVTVYRRETGWMPELFTDPAGSLEVDPLKFSLPLSKLFARTKLG